MYNSIDNPDELFIGIFLNENFKDFYVFLITYEEYQKVYDRGIDSLFTFLDETTYHLNESYPQVFTWFFLIKSPNKDDPPIKFLEEIDKSELLLDEDNFLYHSIESEYFFINNLVDDLDKRIKEDYIRTIFSVSEE